MEFVMYGYKLLFDVFCQVLQDGQDSTATLGHKAPVDLRALTGYLVPLDRLEFPVCRAPPVNLDPLALVPRASQAQMDNLAQLVRLDDLDPKVLLETRVQ